MKNTLTIVLIVLAIILAALLNKHPEAIKTPNKALCSNLLHSGQSTTALEIGCNINQIMREELDIKKTNVFH